MLPFLLLSRLAPAASAATATCDKGRSDNAAKMDHPYALVAEGDRCEGLYYELQSAFGELVSAWRGDLPADLGAGRLYVQAAVPACDNLWLRTDVVVNYQERLHYGMDSDVVPCGSGLVSYLWKTSGAIETFDQHLTDKEKPFPASKLDWLLTYKDGGTATARALPVQVDARPGEKLSNTYHLQINPYKDIKKPQAVEVRIQGKTIRCSSSTPSPPGCPALTRASEPDRFSRDPILLSWTLSPDVRGPVAVRLCAYMKTGDDFVQAELDGDVEDCLDPKGADHTWRWYEIYAGGSTP